jgi:hypothetical protein
LLKGNYNNNNPDLNLEAERTMELVLFDMIQPDWLHSSEKAAIEFLKRLKILIPFIFNQAD